MTSESQSNTKRKKQQRMRVGAAAEYMGLSRYVVRRLIAAGELRALRVGSGSAYGNGTLFIERSDVEKYVKRNQVARGSHEQSSGR